MTAEGEERPGRGGPRVEDDVPASVRAVLETLRREAPLTMKAMQERTGLGRRTLYTVLQRLRAAGFLRERVNLRDTRQTYYWVEG